MHAILEGCHKGCSRRQARAMRSTGLQSTKHSAAAAVGLLKLTDAPALPCLPRPACICRDEEIAQCCQVLGEVAKEVLK